MKSNQATPQAAQSNKRLTIVIPTYNEADNLPEMVHALADLQIAGLQILVVDDNSPDGTGDVAEQLVAEYRERLSLAVLHRQDKSGLGTAYIEGMKGALAGAHGLAPADRILQMDADFSHSPCYILQMLGVMEATNADVVVGSRYVPGGSLDEGWEWSRRLMSWFANVYTRIILGNRTRDMTAGFKLWSRSALRNIDLDKVRSNGYSFQVEMAYLSERLGYHIIEIPIHFEDRRIGQSKLDIPVKLESGWRTWQIRWRYRHLHGKTRPVEGTSNARFDQTPILRE